VGWIEKNAATIGLEGERVPAMIVVNSPPELTIDKLARVVRSEHILLRGKASDESRVRDVYIMVGNNKVFFKPSREPGSSEISFEAEVPLKNGLNYVSVVAEETSDLFTSETIAIRRDREDGMAYLLPRAFNGDPEPLGAMPKTGEFQ
jgi:hypothetical protein